MQIKDEDLDKVLADAEDIRLKRRHIELTCPACHGPHVKAHRNNVYCSNVCRMAVHTARERRKAASKLDGVDPFPPPAVTPSRIGHC